MNTAYILLGTNLGDRIDNLKTASDKISSGCGNIVQASSLYETSPWGVTEQPTFLNCVLEVNTLHSPEKLLQILLDIEKQMGRIRIVKWGERLIDLDLLYFNHTVLSSENLTLPHPELHHRKFTLIPLCEIAPDYVHPILNKTNLELLESCSDDGVVTKIVTSL